MMTLRACMVVCVFTLALIAARLRVQESGRVLGQADERTALVEGIAARHAFWAGPLLGLMVLVGHWVRSLHGDYLEMGLMASVVAPVLVYTVVSVRAATARSAEAPHLGFLPRAGRHLVALAAAFWLWFGISSALSGDEALLGWILYLLPGTVMAALVAASWRHPVVAGSASALLGLVTLGTAVYLAGRNPIGLVLIGMPMLVGGVLVAVWSR